MNGRATIKDIAKDTGFSVTTVSLVLNGKAVKIPENTKLIIEKSAKKLNYRPNQLAISLVKKHSNTIGLIVSDINNVFFGAMAKGVEDFLYDNGYNLILCNTNDKHQGDLDYIKILADKGVDGIVYSMSVDTTLQKARVSTDLMKKNRIPFVMVDRYFKYLEVPVLRVNHIYGGYCATKHLLGLGHKKIACVTGPSCLQDSNDRLFGYKKALEESDIHYNQDLIIEGNYSWESGITAMKSMADKDFTAIFAFNDMMAYGVYNQAKKIGLNIPEDFSLVGYDDIFFSKMLEVPLTTVRQPVYELGKKAAEQLLQLINNKKMSAVNIIFQPELVIRKSTSSPDLQQ
jgi:LacI family transcriptional regulator